MNQIPQRNQKTPSLSPELMQKMIVQDAKAKSEDRAEIIAMNLAVASLRHVENDPSSVFLDTYTKVQQVLEKIYVERGLVALHSSFEMQAQPINEAPKALEVPSIEVK